MAKNKFRSNTRGLRQIRQDLRTGAKGEPLKTCFSAIGDVYLNFVRDKYLTNARGGGKWRKLKASTLKAKLLKGITAPVIMIESQALFNALDRGRAGNEFTLSHRGIIVGFNDRQIHPNAGINFRKLAVAMEDGDEKRNRPPRPILIPPTNKVKKLFNIIAGRCMEQLLNRAGRRL